MKPKVQIIACLLGAIACFYQADLARLEAVTLRAQAMKTLDATLGKPLYGNVRGVGPDGVEEENPWVIDPAEKVKMPGAPELMRRADAEYARADARKTLATTLQYCGYALIGAAIVLLGLTALPEPPQAATPEPKKETPNGPSANTA